MGMSMSEVNHDELELARSENRRLRNELHKARLDQEFLKSELGLAQAAERRAKDALLMANRERAKSLDVLLREIMSWQEITFPAATIDSVMEHLRREVAELSLNPRSGEEMADVLHLLAALSDHACVDLVAATRRKFEINKARRWKPADSMGVREHQPEPAIVEDLDVDGGH